MTKEEIWNKTRHFKIETDVEKLDLIDIDIYLDLLDKYNDLQHQLEEKDKFINEAINFINMIKDETYQSSVEGICDTALEILERGKNVKN